MIVMTSSRSKLLKIKVVGPSIDLSGRNIFGVQRLLRCPRRGEDRSWSLSLERDIFRTHNNIIISTETIDWTFHHHWSCQQKASSRIRNTSILALSTTYYSYRKIEYHYPHFYVREPPISSSFATCYIAEVFQIHVREETRTPGALFTWWKELMYPGLLERATVRHDMKCPTLLWLTRLARPQWTVGGRFGEAFPLSTSDPPPRHPVSTSYTLTVTLTLSTSDSIATSTFGRIPPSLPRRSLSLSPPPPPSSFSLFSNSSSSLYCSSAIRTEKVVRQRPAQTPALARTRVRINLIHEKQNGIEVKDQMFINYFGEALIISLKYPIEILITM